MNRRNECLDIIRGVAVILMVFGHCIQYGNGVEYSQPNHFFYDKVFQVIYSFHMPLFMILSGYLFAFTLRKCHSFGDFAKNRFQRILLPIIGWQTVDFAERGIKLIGTGQMSLAFLVEYVRSWFEGSWFLWAVFYCSIAIFIVQFYLKGNCLIYASGLILTFFVPDYIYNMELYKFMYPFFIGGYLFAICQEKWKTKYFRVTLKHIFAFSAICYLVLLAFWNYDAYIYTSGYTLLGCEDLRYQFIIDIYRMLIGFAGSIVMITGMYLIYHSKLNLHRLYTLIGKIGKASLGIYLISGILVGRLLIRHLEYYSFNYFNNVVQAVIIIAISYLCTALIGKIKGLNFILLGGR